MNPNPVSVQLELICWFWTNKYIPFTYLYLSMAVNDKLHYGRLIHIMQPKEACTNDNGSDGSRAFSFFDMKMPSSKRIYR